MPKLADAIIAVITAVGVAVLLWWAGAALNQQQELINQQQKQIEATRGAQECIIRLLLVEPEQRSGFTVESILDQCPDALPQREGGKVPSVPTPAPKSLETPVPSSGSIRSDAGESRQPWETAE